MATALQPVASDFDGVALEVQRRAQVEEAQAMKAEATSARRQVEALAQQTASEAQKVAEKQRQLKEQAAALLKSSVDLERRGPPQPAGASLYARAFDQSGMKPPFGLSPSCGHSRDTHESPASAVSDGPASFHFGVKMRPSESWCAGPPG